ncbi:MAG: diacylglycerol kinase, partial [Elusimicrobiota bacterium]|nr:diacylglycerol kinase [Elusimicrobiota bacterium]
MPGQNRKPAIIDSFNVAIHGLIHAIKTQRNMRIHIILAVLVLIASFFLNLSRIEFLIVIITIALVFITEIFNTGIEYLVDLVTEEHHPLAKIIKDLSAGAVLFAALSAAIVGYIIFVKKEVLEIFEHSIVFSRIAAYPPYYTGVIVFLIVVVSLFIKGVFGKEAKIAGGMPSIHSAVAFALSTIIYFASENIYIYGLAIFIAGLVAQTRISAGIHTFWEVLAGSLLGITVTLFIL